MNCNTPAFNHVQGSNFVAYYRSERPGRQFTLLPQMWDLLVKHAVIIQNLQECYNLGYQHKSQFT